MRVAILDLYDGEKNAGLAAIQQIITEQNHEFTTFDIRTKLVFPKLTGYDAFISTGGPGDPSEQHDWANQWRRFMEAIIRHNASQKTPKPVFLICLSFQLFCHHFELGLVSLRDKPSYGICQAHLTPYGKNNSIFGQLPSPFLVADFRHYQITNPNRQRLDDLGSQILALEFSPKTTAINALMAIQFTPHILGCQFHPEVKGTEVRDSFLSEKEKYINLLGVAHYSQIIAGLNETDQVTQVQKIILPSFLTDTPKKVVL